MSINQQRVARRWCAALASITMMAAVLAVASPAAAQAPGDFYGIADDDTGPVTNTGSGGTSTGGGSPIAAPEPIANTGAAEYDTLWTDENVPTGLTTLRDNDNVDVWTYAPDDHSAFMALIIINNADAPTEYRFEHAVPEGHTAEVQDDGSVRFFDAGGNEAGGVMAPWAVDADGNDITTSYRLDGDTIIQTVNHQDAVYPVVADPLWIPIAVAVGRCVINTFCRTTAVQAVRLAPAVVGTAWRNRGILTSGDSNAPGRRPTNTCNARGRLGC